MNGCFNAKAIMDLPFAVGCFCVEVANQPVEIAIPIYMYLGERKVTIHLFGIC